jgi:4-amino-4-deoxy-L-arabinose transferase-like glycosyltransferase
MRWIGWLLGIVFLGGLAYGSLFYRLDNQPLYRFDEAKHASKAGEAVLDGHYFVLHFRARSTTTSTKPPFVIWLQACSLSLLGFNELAIRLPAAFSGLLLVISFLFFSYKWFSSLIPGFFGSIVLLTSDGFLFNHCARKGEIDATLCLFIFLYFSCFLTAIAATENRENRRYLLFGFLCLALAGITKGVAAFLISPAILIIALWRKKAGDLIRSDVTWTGVFIVIVVVIGYYFWRWLFDPGYLRLVIRNELGGRFLVDQQQLDLPWYQHLRSLVDFNFKKWIFVVPVLTLLAIGRKGEMRYLTVGMLVGVFVQLLVISLAQTRGHDHYALPIVPLLSFIIGMGFFVIHQACLKQLSNSSGAKLVFSSLFIFSLAFYPVKNVLGSVLDEGFNPADVQERYPEFVRRHPELSDFYIASELRNVNLQSALHFLYLKGRAEGRNIHTVEFDYANFRVGDRVLTCSEDHYAEVRRKNRVQLIEEDTSCRLFRILQIY